MNGNVGEHVQDWYADVPQGPLVDPVGPDSGEFKVLRGGGVTGRIRHCGCADRGRRAPDTLGRTDVISGFRLAADIDTKLYPLSSPVEDSKGGDE